MLKRILLNLLYTLLCSTAISSVVLLLVYYNTASLREDFDVDDLFFWLGILYYKLLAYVLISLFVAVPAIRNNRLLSILVYYAGCVIFVLTTLIGINTTAIGGIVVIWMPFVIFVIVHTFFFIRLINGPQPTNAIA